ncbi:hypothetical protein HGP28_18420 [Vibrio sp. SM6]|uniref:Uncharacterized protein n=1 Tax=Vibrio agarilyticus TaxID=2726741 RepID=A0A7X8TUL8_9VIBR|nr:hypothetical protein [Vibrio agarilyticus]NLS14837.1 hypothetical protein [Vibrio agarilyticus]
MSLQHPEDILTHALSTFGEATKGLAEISIGSFTSSSKEFIIYTYLRSKHVKDYKAECITIRFPISIYPLKLTIDDKKMSGAFTRSDIICRDKESLCDALNKFFLSDLFTEEVKLLVNIAAMNKSRS